jgi:hypothetical protein
MRQYAIASALAIFSITLCGCSKLVTPKDRDAVGTYVANLKWGTATLTLNDDHTFVETVETTSGTKTGSGSWHLQKSDSGGNNLRFDGNFLLVDSTTQGSSSPYVATYIQKVFGDVTIVNNPDESESSFNLQKPKRS